jgi:lysozyme family protein
MRHNWDEALLHILKYEGGYVNHPSDPGGMTNLGVTKRVWEEWTGKPATEADMRALTPEMVGPLYKTRYWDAVRGDDLPSGVDLCVFDAAVNAGVGRASKFLQQAVGVTADGQIGPKTLAAITAKPADEVIDEFCALREAHYKSLSTFDTFGKGWMRRLGSVEAESKTLTA